MSENKVTCYSREAPEHVLLRRVAWKAIALFVSGMLAGGCAAGTDPSVEAAVDGALRASVSYVVAPDSYRSGVLPQDLAADWIAKGDTEFARWYGGEALEEQRRGLRNVVQSMTRVAGAIAIAVEVQRFVPGHVVAISGDQAQVVDATLVYSTRYAPGTWDPIVVPGVTMCQLDLRRLDNEWRVVSEACNVSGG